MDTDVLPGVYEAFAQGRERPPSDAYAAPGELFAELLNAEVRGRLTEEERTVVEACWGRQYRAIVAAREERTEDSRQGLRAVRSVLREGSLSTEASLLIQFLLEPAEAYFYYKLGDYERAREYVLRGAALNHRLTDDFGCGIVSAQRMQLCHNILRIDTREGRPEAAVRLGAAFLNYLEFGEACLPPEIAWAWVVRNVVPESIMAFYFDQVCGETALALAGANDPALFEPIARHAGAGCGRAGFAPHAHAWIAAKDLLSRGALEEYFRRSCELLRLGRSAEPSLWYATIIDVVNACRALGSAGARIAGRIADEASSIPGAPWLLRPEPQRPFR